MPSRLVDASSCYKSLERRLKDVVAMIEALEAASSLDDAGIMAERYVRGDAVIRLLQAVQNVKRDPQADFAPIIEDSSKEQLELADISLILLLRMHDIALQRLAEHGWIPTFRGDNAGSVIYHNANQDEESDQPWIAGHSDRWEFRVLLNLPLLCTPTCNENGCIQWSATVIYRGCQYEKQSMDFGILNISGSNTLLGLSDMVLTDDDSPFQGKGLLSVIDLLETDIDSDELVCVRHLVHGVWKCTEHVNRSSLNREKALGEALESFTETTLAASAMLSQSKQCLIIGIGCGNLPSFLKRFTRIEVDIFETSQILIEIVEMFFEFDRSSFGAPLIGALSLLDQLEPIYDSILISDPSIQLKGIEKLLNPFNSLACIAVAGLTSFTVNRMERRIIREHHLRDVDYTVDDDDEVIVLFGGPRKISVEMWQKSMNGLNSGSMDVVQAQKTRVLHISSFLSRHEIQMIHETARNATECGIESRSEIEGIWTVKHLHTKGYFAAQLPHLYTKIVDQARSIGSEIYDNANGELLFNVRCIEYHTMLEGGHLPDPRHFDQDSLITIDIMLSNPEIDFQNGSLQTLETDGSLTIHEFNQGDANVFVSHKAHCVDRVTNGQRHVLVIELWRGPNCHCPHRCLCLQGVCPLDPQTSRCKVMQSPYSSLPFRLGAIQKSSMDTIELLWEPTHFTSNDSILYNHHHPIVNVEDDENWNLF